MKNTRDPVDNLRLKVTCKKCKCEYDLPVFWVGGVSNEFSGGSAKEPLRCPDCGWCGNLGGGGCSYCDEDEDIYLDELYSE